MNFPYTEQPLEALVAAEASVGVVLGALIWLRPPRPRASAALFALAVALAALAPAIPPFLNGVGIHTPDSLLRVLLKLAAALATVSAVVTRRRLFAGAALAGEAALWAITDLLPDSDRDLAAAHLVFFGLLLGIHLHTQRAPWTSERLRRASGGPVWHEDVVVFVLATLLGVASCWVLLHGQTSSGDEWADTYQASLFAKGRAYAAVPPCAESFRSYWVFQYEGRSFAQYTPGWPYFMTPFIWLHAPWLAAPAALGVAAAGVMRLGRRVGAGLAPFEAPLSSPFARMSGRIAAAILLASSTVLVNAGTRYPHVFVAAMFAWAVEAACAIAPDGELEHRAQWAWGAVLGSALCLLLATRPGDGLTLSTGVGLYALVALVRRRIGWRSFVATGIAGTAIGALTLVILRLQIGRWGETGYSVTEVIYPWAKVQWSLPKANEVHLALPLAAGAYCWFPCSPALGLAGLAALRGRGRRVAFMFFFSVVACVTLYTLSNFSRGNGPGYGPRFLLPTVVPMAVGTGVVLAAAWAAALAPARTRCPPVVLGVCATALFLGVLRLAPLIYPHTYSDARAHNHLGDAIAAEHLHRAVVFAGPGVSNIDAMDLTEDYPIDLYDDQDVLVVIDQGADSERCVRDAVPGRAYYRAEADDPIKLSRMPP